MEAGDQTETQPPRTFRDELTATVRALREISNRLYALQQKEQANVPLTEEEQEERARLLEEQGPLELRLHELMRPREKSTHDQS